MTTATQDSENLDLTRSGIIEASAGTGKTYTIAEIYLALLSGQKKYPKSVSATGEAPSGNRDVPRVRDILVVTFTEAATAELRARLRARIRTELETSAERESRNALLLADAEFDEAAIFTIHGFCLRVLKEFGLSLKTDTIRASISEELSRFVEYWRARKIASGNDVFLTLSAGELCDVIKPSLQNPKIIPTLPEVADASTAALYLAATEALAEWREHRKTAESVSYNEILTELRDALCNTPELASKIARRYKIAIVDEFQDTDPVQWEIFSKIFLANKNPLFCVGDPKQAIYEFRGGDIATYRYAREKIRTLGKSNALTLRENFRSAPEMIAAFNEILAFDARIDEAFNIGTYKKPEILRVPVRNSLEYQPTLFPQKKISPENRDAILEQEKTPAAVLKLTEPQSNKSTAKERIARQIASDIEDLVRARGIPASEIAILTADNDEAQLYRSELSSRNIPAATTARGNVLCEPIAQALTDILLAMLEPQNTARFRRALLTPFFGETSKVALLAPDDSAHASLFDPLRHAFSEAHKQWARAGFLSAFQKLSAALDFSKNISEKEHSASLATNLLHLCEILHTLESNGKLAPRTLVNAYQTLLTNADPKDEDDALQLRSAVDRDAVRILTMHKSKGLEFDIVFLPSLWTKSLNSAKPAKFVKQIDARNETRLLLRNGNEISEEFRRAELQNNFENSARLFYVALTRAKSRVVVYHALQQASRNPWNSYQRSLFSAAGLLKFSSEENPLPHWKTIPADEALPAEIFPKRLTPTAPDVTTRKPALLSPEEAEDRFSRAEAALKKLSSAPEGLFSFSRLIKASEFDANGVREDDEQAADTPRFADEDTTGSDFTKKNPGFPQKTFLTLPSGKEFGTVTHSIFEFVNFRTCENLETLLTREISHLKNLPKKSSREYRKLVEDFSDMVRGNLALPLLDGTFRLNALADDAEIREMEFHFPLKQSNTLYSELFRLFRSWGGIYAETAEFHWKNSESAKQLNVGGMMTGIIDLTFRAHDKFYVLDWKTNSIITDEVSADYNLPQEALRKEIVRHGYALQWTVYALALRNFLKQSLRERYNHAEHFGGIIYLFVRWCAPFYDTTTLTEERLDALEQLLVDRKGTSEN